MPWISGADAMTDLSARMADWALFYAARKVPVLPLWGTVGLRCDCGDLGCKSQGKHPLGRLVPHGKDDASTDLRLIAEWFTRYPLANVGVRPPDGLLVLDVDPRNGGDRTLAELQLRFTWLPATLEAATGGGGRHLWYAYGGPIRRGTLGAGVDVKTSSGLLVMPPSLHASGRRYSWTTQLPVAWAPEWLGGILDPPRPARASTVTGNGHGLVRAVAAASEGNRNNVLLWAACRAVEDGLDDPVLDELADAAVAGGQTSTEVRSTIASARRRAAS